MNLSGWRIAGPFDAYDLHSSAMAAVEEPTTLEWDAPLWRTALAQFEQALEHADVSAWRSRAAALSGARRGRLRADPPRFGRRCRVPCVPRAALDRARADEGRHPLRPARLARRVRRARDVDDLEVRAPATAVRRRQGRCPLQPARHVHRRDRAADASLHRRAGARHRPEGGHPRPGHGHERADDGLDDGHLLDADRPCRAGDRDGQADLHRRLACFGTRRPAPAS